MVTFIISKFSESNKFIRAQEVLFVMVLFWPFRVHPQLTLAVIEGTHSITKFSLTYHRALPLKNDDNSFNKSLFFSRSSFSVGDFWSFVRKAVRMQPYSHSSSSVENTILYRSILHQQLYRPSNQDKN